MRAAAVFAAVVLAMQPKSAIHLVFAHIRLPYALACYKYLLPSHCLLPILSVAIWLLLGIFRFWTLLLQVEYQFRG